MGVCQLLSNKGVTGLVCRSARALSRAMLCRSTSCTAMTCAMALAAACLGELEIDAEKFPLAVGELTELSACAECRVTVAECLFAAHPHVQMGSLQADDAEVLWLLSGVVTKGMGRCGYQSLVWVMAGCGRVWAVHGAGVPCPLTLCLTLAVRSSIFGRSGEQGHDLGYRLSPVAMVGNRSSSTKA